MQGCNVLHPMGWDAFGLPAENYAIKHGVHPRVTTAAAIANFRRQIDAVGFAYDWEREVDTTDPGVRAAGRSGSSCSCSSSGLAYEGGRPDQLVPVVQDRPGQRRGQPGALRALRHASSCARTCASGCCASPRYADRLLEDLDELDWPDVDAGDAAQLDRPQRRAPR